MPHQEKNTSEECREMQQSQTTDQLIAPRGRDTEHRPPHDTWKIIKLKKPDYLPQQADCRKHVRMTRKYHNHRPQTKSQYQEKETHNQLSLSEQDDCKKQVSVACNRYSYSSQTNILHSDRHTTAGAQFE